MLDVLPSDRSCQAEIPLLKAIAPPRQPPPPAQAPGPALALPPSPLGYRLPMQLGPCALPALVNCPQPDLRLRKLPFYYTLSRAECVPQIRMLES